MKKSYGNIEGNRYAGVYASIVLPSLAVGTVGGGTNLATQKECLNLIGCYGKVFSILYYMLYILCDCVYVI